MTKGSLLSLCANLFDPLLLAAPFIATARMLFRKVIREVGDTLPTWKSKIPAQYYGLAMNLAREILTVAKR